MWRTGHDVLRESRLREMRCGQQCLAHGLVCHSLRCLNCRRLVRRAASSSRGSMHIEDLRGWTGGRFCTRSISRSRHDLLSGVATHSTPAFALGGIGRIRPGIAANVVQPVVNNNAPTAVSMKNRRFKQLTLDGCILLMPSGSPAIDNPHRCTCPDAKGLKE